MFIFLLNIYIQLYIVCYEDNIHGKIRLRGLILPDDSFIVTSHDIFGMEMVNLGHIECEECNDLTIPTMDLKCPMHKIHLKTALPSGERQKRTYI